MSNPPVWNRAYGAAFAPINRPTARKALPQPGSKAHDPRSGDDYVQMLQYTVRYRDGLDRLSPREMNDIANECPMSRLGGTHPVRYLRQMLQTKGAA